MLSLIDYIFMQGCDTEPWLGLSPSNSITQSEAISFPPLQPLSEAVMHAGNGNKGGSKMGVKRKQSDGAKQGSSWMSLLTRDCT